LPQWLNLSNQFFQKFYLLVQFGQSLFQRPHFGIGVVQHYGTGHPQKHGDESHVRIYSILNFDAVDFFRRIHLGITLPGLGQSDNKNGEVFFQLVPVISFQQDIHERCQEGGLPHGHVPKQVREGVIVQILGPIQSIAAALLKTVPTRVRHAKPFGILHLSDPDLCHLYYQFVDFRYLYRVKPRVQVESVEKKESKAIRLSYA
jgi:hypothetical protein